jgi:hypothetical protein
LHQTGGDSMFIRAAFTELFARREATKVVLKPALSNA